MCKEMKHCLRESLKAVRVFFLKVNYKIVLIKIKPRRRPPSAVYYENLKCNVDEKLATENCETLRRARISENEHVENYINGI